MNSRAYVARFNFSGTDQQKKVGMLSGGERNRVHLARMLKAGANVLLLDEPTNDLDVNTLRALEEALENFAGCAVVISHDRWFLDRIATHILAFEGDSKVVWFEGNYTEYEADRHKRDSARRPTSRTASSIGIDEIEGCLVFSVSCLEWVTGIGALYAERPSCRDNFCLRYTEAEHGPFGSRSRPSSIRAGRLDRLRRPPTANLRVRAR